MDKRTLSVDLLRCTWIFRVFIIDTYRPLPCV